MADWQWATIAAFMAVAVTLWVANSESRQRRQQLRQGAVLDINFHSNVWLEVFPDEATQQAEVLHAGVALALSEDSR